MPLNGMVALNYRRHIII